MAWIQSDQKIKDHYKTKDLMREMGWSLEVTIGKLHLLWWWCVDHAPLGDLRKHHDKRIADAMCVDTQDATRLVEALVKSCWIDREPFFRVHDWHDNFGLFLRRNRPEMFDELMELYADRTVSVREPTIPNLTKPKLTKTKTLAADDSPPMAKKQFVPPTPEEVSAYAKTINFSLDGEKFCAYYDTRGWVVGKSKMKDWHAAVVTWKKNSPSFSAGASSKFDVERAADEREKKKIELLKSGRCVNVVNGRFCGGKPDESGFCSVCQTIKVTDILNLKSANSQK